MNSNNEDPKKNDKAKKLETLRKMNDQFTAPAHIPKLSKNDDTQKEQVQPAPGTQKPPQKPLPQIPNEENQIAEQLDLLNRYFVRKANELDTNYQQTLEELNQLSLERDRRMVDVLNRQDTTLSNMVDLMKGLLLQNNRTERRIGQQETELTEQSDATEERIGRVLNLVGEQSQMIISQTALIKELMRRNEKLTQQTNEQNRKQGLQRFDVEKLKRQVKEYASKWASLQQEVNKLADAFEEKQTNDSEAFKEVDAFLDYFNNECLPLEVKIDSEDDDQVYKEVLGDNYLEILNSDKKIGKSAAQTKSASPIQELIEEDRKDKQLSSGSGSTVTESDEEIEEIIEEDEDGNIITHEIRKKSKSSDSGYDAHDSN